MKQSLIFTAIVMLVIFMTSCDKNFETFENMDGNSEMPSNISSIVSEALPGQILLKWDVPVDSNYYFVQVKYFDHLTQKDVYKVVSVYSDSLLVDDTRAKFGDYEFTFQTFSKKNINGAKTTVIAKSGAAIATQTITTTEIKLTESQLSTNSQEPSEGPIANLIDDDSNTFFHTIWSIAKVDFPLYIQVDLDEPIDDFQFYFQNRAWSQVGGNDVQVQISQDGENWETISEIIAGLPSGGGGEYTSEVFQLGHTFTHFRYNVISTYDNHSYFNMAEFKIFDVEIDVYDPEL